MSNDSEKTLKEIHDYWKSHSSPDYYMDKIDRSEFLINYINKYIEQNGKILEIGCNVGRNLNYLYKNNFNNLTGIEISEEAIRSLKKTYPLLAKNTNIIHSPVEDIIKELPTKHFELVFTMAVLEHIHPESEWVFEDIARITGGYLITIEAEKAKNWRIFPREYKEIFERFGLKQLEETRCDSIADLRAYTLRVFKK